MFFLQLNIFPQILYCFSKVPTNIIEIYQKINFSEKTKKLNSEVYDMQTDILTKLYTEKKQEIFLIWRELMLLII